MALLNGNQVFKLRYNNQFEYVAGTDYLEVYNYAQEVANQLSATVSIINKGTMMIVASVTPNS